MIQIKFKNLKRSDWARNAVQERVESLVEKFSDLSRSKVHVTLEMLNSPIQAGPDLFKVKLCVQGGRYSGVLIEKLNPNLYVALAEVIDHMLEALNRLGDRIRIKERKKAREIVKKVSPDISF